MKKLLAGAACALVMGAMAASSVSLDGEWTLDYFPQPDAGAVRTLPLAVPFKTVKATVPGNCELDLVNAGILPPMEIGLNVLKLRPYECFQWLYTKKFEAPAVDVASGARAVLVFGGIDTLPLVVGFLAAFIAGCLACKWMINIVKRGKLVWFGVYCVIAGIVAIALSQLMPAPAF